MIRVGGFVRAAGGVVVRRTGDAVEMLVVHRPRYDDWTFPKGKRQADESDEECAAREVEEETGLRCRLDAELPGTEYSDHRGRPKRVRYWLMEPVGGTFAPSDEVDEVRWVTAEVAASLLSYDHDRRLAERASGASGGL